jgi:osmoprotectant transport system ATP-binding protein
MPTATTLFETRNLTKRFGETTALDDVSLELERGTTTAVIGPSGCGKSTLLNCLNGLIQPDSGDVFFAGQLITEMDHARRVEVRRRIGYVIQEGGLFPHLTAHENAELVSKLCGDAPNRRAARVRELAQLVDLPHERLRDYPDQLSGGERQRVGIIRALMREPEALLLDEPMGALDPLTRAGLQGDLSEIFDRLGTTVVLVTHDLAEAATLADTIVVMRDGSVVQRADFATLRDSPANDFVAEFVSAQRRSSEVLHR